MGLTGCYAVMKYLVFFLNLIFWITGLFLISLSVWMLTDPTFYVSMAQDESSYYSGVYLLLAVGILLFIVGFLGCCGTLKESQVMLVLFFCVLLIILVAEVSAAAWAYSKRKQLEELVRESVKTTVQQEYGPVESRTQTFDAIQKGLECCGINGPTDWSGTKYNRDDKPEFVISGKIKVFNIPASCCSTDPNDPSCVAARKVTLGAQISDVIYSQVSAYKNGDYFWASRNNYSNLTFLLHFLGMHAAPPPV
ncbi:hypothetical protein AAG570_008535 [Ranatra chinensis]|uniref:Tetraspanin n=1 Tax=Ranatra chinensis TaxID=642074 RepID=A0ABD0Z429_9HEMI